MERSRNPKNSAYYESELFVPPAPKEIAYLWRIYTRIRRRKGSNGFGANPIEGLDIESFERRFRFPLQPWEHEVLEEIDDLYMAQQSKPHTTTVAG